MYKNKCHNCGREKIVTEFELKFFSGRDIPVCPRCMFSAETIKKLEACIPDYDTLLRAMKKRKKS